MGPLKFSGLPLLRLLQRSGRFGANRKTNSGCTCFALVAVAVAAVVLRALRLRLAVVVAVADQARKHLF